MSVSESDSDLRGWRLGSVRRFRTNMRFTYLERLVPGVFVDVLANSWLARLMANVCAVVVLGTDDDSHCFWRFWLVPLENKNIDVRFALFAVKTRSAGRH